MIGLHNETLSLHMPKFAYNSPIDHSIPFEIIFGHIIPFILDLSLVPYAARYDVVANFLIDHREVFEKLTR